MFNRIRFRNCIHQGVAGATEESILAAIRGDPEVCAPNDPATNPSKPAFLAIFVSLARYLGEQAFKQCWMDFQRASQGRSNLAEFPAYLAEHRYGRERADLVDLARLDLAIFLADVTSPKPSLGGCCLPNTILTDHLGLTVTMQPNWHYLKSNWPIHQFREMLLKRPAGEARARPPRLSTTWLNILPGDGEIVTRELPPARFQFESGLQRGRSLQEAGRRAIDFDPRFDALAALNALIAAGAIADVNLHPDTTS
jgi:hypothetical protein